MMLQSKFEQNKKSDSQRQREQLNKEQDQYIRQLRRQHQDDLKQLKEQLHAEKEEAIKVALELHGKTQPPQRDVPCCNNSHSRPGSNSAIIVKLQREIIALKDEKKQLEEKYRLNCISEAEKSEEIRQMKREHEEYKIKVQESNNLKTFDQHNERNQLMLSGAEHSHVLSCDLEMSVESAAENIPWILIGDNSILDSDHHQRSSEIDGTEADVTVDQLEHACSEQVEERIVEGHDEEILQTSITETSPQYMKVS
jgi:hypothetical protein